MITAALHKIERRLDALAEASDDQHPIDPHELRIVARQVQAQAEILEQGIAE